MLSVVLVSIPQPLLQHQWLHVRTAWLAPTLGAQALLQPPLVFPVMLVPTPLLLQPQLWPPVCNVQQALTSLALAYLQLEAAHSVALVFIPQHWTLLLRAIA